MRNCLWFVVLLLFLSTVSNIQLSHYGNGETHFASPGVKQEVGRETEEGKQVMENTGVIKNLIDPEFIGMQKEEKVKIFIATENLRGLADELRKNGINVSFGRTITYSKLILPVIEVEAQQVPMISQVSNALFVGKYPEIENLKPEKNMLSAPHSMLASYTGNNTTTLMLTDGIEFGLPGLKNTWATWAEGTAYAGYPDVFDFASIYDYLEDGEISSTSWFVNTSWNASAYVENGSVYIDYMGEKFNVTGIPSLSSTYHIGLMPSLPGRNRSAVLVTDANELWHYDTVYVDLDNDHSFGDEHGITKDSPIYTRDLNFDGTPDISTGLLYWISDGIHPIPHSQFVAERFGFENPVPENGCLLAFFGDYSNSTGSQIAQALIMNAPKTKILPVVVRNETNIFEAWLFCAYGNDYLPKSGDEKDICLSNFLLRIKTNYWSYIDRYFTNLLTSTRVIFVLPALENPEQFSPLSNYALYAGTYNLASQNFVCAPANEIATFLVGSQISLYPSFAQTGYSWGLWAEQYSGIALSTAIASAVVAKILEILKGQGIQVMPEFVREVIASASENTLLDALSQGRGILNESQALAIANFTAGLEISPLSLDFGNYEGMKYPSFSRFVYPNNTYKENITLLSLNTGMDVNLVPVMLKRISHANFSFSVAQNASHFLSITQVLDKNASVGRITACASNGQKNAGDFEIDFYVWLDSNENQVEDPGEIHLIYRARMLDGLGSFSAAISNWTHVEGAFLEFLPLAENPDLDFQVEVDWFNYTNFDWINQVTLFLPENFPLNVEIELNVPANASIGSYEGKLLLLGTSLNKSIAFRINVIGELDKQYEIDEEGYAGEVTAGSGGLITAQYYFYVPATAQELWNNVVVEINLTQNAGIEHYFLYPDTFSILARKTFGPGALISTAAIGEHLPKEIKAEDAIVLPLMPGLNSIRLSSQAIVQKISARWLKIYGLNLSGETQLEGTVWQDKLAFLGRCSAGLNLSATGIGLTPAEEMNLKMDENHTAHIQITLNQTMPFLCFTDANAWLSIWSEEDILVAYSVLGKIYIPYLKEGTYTITGFSMRENVNVSFVAISGSGVGVEVFPEGEIEPYTDFFIGAYLPQPSKPGNYFASLSLQFRNEATPYLFPFSERIIDLPPYFTELWPSNGSVLREATIHGKYADSEGTLKTEVVEVYLYLNGVNYSQFCVFNATEFSLSVLLAEGDYRVYVEIKDANGMAGSGEIFFTLDRTAPFLNIVSPENYLITRDPLLFVFCESEAEATVYVNQEMAEIEDPGVFFCGIYLIEGWNVLEVKAVDRAGNMALQVLYVYLDSVPPQILITWPENGYITRSPFLTVSGITEGDALVSVNGVSTRADHTGKFSVGISIEAEGQNLIEVVAKDIAGNENRYGFGVVLDRTPPEIVLDALEPLTASKVITVSGMVRDANPEPYVVVNSMRVELMGGRFTAGVLLSEGSNLIKISAIDKAGNVNSKILTVILDTTPPALNLSLPQSVTQPRITINGSTEPGAKLYINNVSVYVNPQGNFSYQINLTKGVNFITVNVSDALGNTRLVTFAVLYVNPNDLNVEDTYRYNTLDKKLTELMDSLVFAVLCLVVIFAVGLIGLYKYIIWRLKKEEKTQTLKEIFEEKP